MRAKFLVFPLVATLLILCTACAGGSKEPSTPLESPPSSSPQMEHAEHPIEGEELIALTDTREEAEALAVQYGIELVSWEQKIAVFHTEKDPFTVIEEGKRNDWPPLEINAVISLR